MKSYFSNNAPKAIGTYANAVGNLLYCSGQTPIEPLIKYENN